MGFSFCIFECFSPHNVVGSNNKSLVDGGVIALCVIYGTTYLLD